MTAFPRSPFLALAAAETVEGTPRRRFAKELIRCGLYYKAADNLEFEVTPDTLVHWRNTFQAMKAAGIRVPMPATHERSGDPDANRGYIDDLVIDGDSLIGIATMIGKDGIDAAARSDVSIFSPPYYVDDQKRRWERPIMHVALTTEPVVSGLRDFVPIAASRNAQETAMIEQIKTLVKAAGIDTEVTAANAGDLAKQAAAAITAARTKSAIGGQNPPATATSAATPDPMLVKLAADNRRMKLDSLVAAGRITPAVRDKLAETYIGKENGALTVALSRGDDGSQFDALVAALAENKPVPMGELSGPQLPGIALGNPAVTPEKSSLIETAKAQRAAWEKQHGQLPN